jgi:hypothetical protein
MRHLYQLESFNNCFDHNLMFTVCRITTICHSNMHST